MPELVELDAPPKADVSDELDDDGKVACPECQNRFKPGGLKRHLTVTHGYESSTQNTGGISSGGKRGYSIETSGAQLQRGASILVAMACKDCAIVLYKDAQKDWKAIDDFCEHRPKLKKQVIGALQGADLLILLSVFTGTAQSMLSHHSIGKRFSIGVMDLDQPENPEHSQHSKGDAMQNMAQFLEAMDPEERNVILNQAVTMAANGGIQS